MSGLPTVVVTGATGAQGGAVARVLQTSGRWNVRAVTRKPEGTAAGRLRRSGMGVVHGDLNDPDVGAAVLPEASALFVVTNFWEPQRHSEYVQGERIIDAAIAAGIDNIVYSTLPGIAEITGGELVVPHCDGKYALEKHLRATGAAVAFVQPDWYFQNWHAVPNFRLHRAPDGAVTFANAIGDGCLPAVDIEDIGPTVATIMEDPARFRGVTVRLVSEVRTSAEYAAAFADRLGEPVRYQPIAREDLLAQGGEAAHLADMFEFFRRYGADVTAEELEHPGLPARRSFDAWLDANVDVFHALLGAEPAM